jgi:hypothetical protein
VRVGGEAEGGKDVTAHRSSRWVRGESKAISGERVVAPCRPPEQDMPGADCAMRINGFSPRGPF